MLAEKFPDEINAILTKYPPEHKRSAVMPLLYLAQREQGYVTGQEVDEIARSWKSHRRKSVQLSVYTLYHDRPEGRYRIQVCTDLPCALRGADQFIQTCSNLGSRLGDHARRPGNC
jgi:NADH-quinone oxidoreductase subunit E